MLAGCQLRMGTAMTSDAGLLCAACTELDVCSKMQISFLNFFFCGDSVAQRMTDLLLICSPGWKLNCVFVKQVEIFSLCHQSAKHCIILLPAPSPILH